MLQPNTLIFVDLASDDPAKAGKFYADVFGWQDDARPAGVFHRMVPGGMFPNPDGSDSQIGNLHLGIFDAANARPHPDPAGVEPRTLADGGPQGADLDPGRRRPVLRGASSQRAVDRGATELWRDHYWKEFNGYNHAFRDPWGNEIVLWGKAGPNPQVPENYTRE